MPKPKTKRQREAAKKRAEKAAAAKLAAIEAKEGPAPKRIKMNMSLANRQVFLTDKTYEVPEDVPAETAISWVKSGAATKVE